MKILLRLLLSAALYCVAHAKTQEQRDISNVDKQVDHHRPQEGKGIQGSPLDSFAHTDEKEGSGQTGTHSFLGGAQRDLVGARRVLGRKGLFGEDSKSNPNEVGQGQSNKVEDDGSERERTRSHKLNPAVTLPVDVKVKKMSKKKKAKSAKRPKSKKNLSEISISSPLPDTTTNERLIDIVGTITPYISGSVRALGVVAPILALGQFRIEGVFLPDGATSINIVANMDDGSVIGERSLEVTYVRLSEGSKPISASTGGEVEVTNENSNVFGARIQVPAGVATHDFTSNIVHDPTHVPVVPFGFVAVGPPVLFTPEAEVFEGFATLSIPIDPAMMPPLTDLSSAQVLSLRASDWFLLPSTLELGQSSINLLTFQVGALDAGPFLPVVETALEQGQVIIETSPTHATIYIDGADTGLRTPAVVNNVDLGQHIAKLYLRGYNEVFHSFDSTLQGARVKIDLDYPAEPIPSVAIDSYLDGFAVSSPFVEIVAHASSEGYALEGGVAILSANGRDHHQNIASDGEIRGYVPLNARHNRVEVRVNGLNGDTGVSPPTIIDKVATPTRRGLRRKARRSLQDPNEIVVLLSWWTDGTDVDLHVFDPNGNHAWFSNKSGIPGAQIDVDDTDGYGPEIFTYPNPVSGTYRVAVDSFDLGEPPRQTTAVVVITVGGNEIFRQGYTFEESDNDETNGDPTGADPRAFWDAFQFEVGSLSITSIKTSQPFSSYDQAIFTTRPGENEIFITTEAPSHISDSSILYDIEEVNEGFAISSLSTIGRSTSFFASHEPLTSLTTPDSHALEYKIVAYVLEDGARSFEAAPVYIKQDDRSQIIQEYVDKKDFNPAFTAPVPSRDTFITESQFSGHKSPHFTFKELAEFSDYYHSTGLALIGASVTIANTLRTEWGYPLFCTSGWRNPRRNDRVGGVVNSFHQLGSAVDIVPSWESSKWPNSVSGCGNINSYTTAQQALACLAQRVFDSAEFDVVSESDHLHIEQQVSDGADGGENNSVEQGPELRLEIGTMTMIGEGNIPYVYWPKTAASGVTLGIGYDIGSRTPSDVVTDLVAAGMSEAQASIIAEGSEKKGTNADHWVENNKQRVGTIEESVIKSLFYAILPVYTQEAKLMATNENPSEGSEALNARSRELIYVPPKPLYTYVMTEEQWNGLHPAMVELLSDLKFHGGFYAYRRIEWINQRLIAHDGNQLEQLRKVAELFGGPPHPSGQITDMDSYALDPTIGLSGGNLQTFFGIPAEDISAATERRNRIRLSFLLKVIKALEAGSTVEMVARGQSVPPGPDGCSTENPHEEPSTCPMECFTPRAQFVREAIKACFPDTQKLPTTYLEHSGYGNSLDAWPALGGLGIAATGQMEADMDALALWLMENHQSLKMYYMIWKNRIWNPSRDAFGAWWDCTTPVNGEYRCACMKDGSCGHVTLGHFDHVHVTVLH